MQRDTIILDGKEYFVKTIKRLNQDGVKEPYDIYIPIKTIIK